MPTLLSERIKPILQTNTFHFFSPDRTIKPNFIPEISTFATGYSINNNYVIDNDRINDGDDNKIDWIFRIRFRCRNISFLDANGLIVLGISFYGE